MIESLKPFFKYFIYIYIYIYIIYIYIYSYIKMSKNKPAKYDQDLSEEQKNKTTI